MDCAVMLLYYSGKGSGVRDSLLEIESSSGESLAEGKRRGLMTEYLNPEFHQAGRFIIRIAPFLHFDC